MVWNDLKHEVKAPSPSLPPVKVKHTPSEDKRMGKNVYVVSLGFCLLFTAYNSIGNLQSSIHPEGGLGTYGTSVVYAALIISSLLIPTYAIRKLTAKWTIVIAMVGYTPYMVAQFFPSFATIIPTAVILGLSGGPLWSAKCFYLTHVGNKYASLVATSTEVVIVRFFGIFFALFQTSNVWGNLISSYILSSSESTWEVNETQLAKCGASFCPGDLWVEKDEVKSAELTRKINIFCGVMIVIAYAGVGITAIFLDSLGRYGEKERLELDAEKMDTMQQLIATFRHMKNPYQLLLIPITIFLGLECSFFGADFTQAYITCSWGVEHVGYVLICFGLVNAFFSAALGPIMRLIGRLPIFLLGAAINTAVIAVYFTWKPDPNTPILFFVIAGFWGAADAIWQTQINAFYGYIFPSEEEAAFSNFRFWESIGFIIGYANSNNSCIRPKLYLLSGFLVVGMLCFLVIEVMERKKMTNQLRQKCPSA